MVVTEGAIGARTGGSGAMSFTSLLLNIKKNFANVSFVEQVASACLDNHLSISWSLSMSIVRG
jgi:hypothetical protein